jgi:hypothetical protein
MDGYFEDLNATAAAIRDGWMHTGDVAVVHPDRLCRNPGPPERHHHQRLAGS